MGQGLASSALQDLVLGGKPATQKVEPRAPRTGVSSSTRGAMWACVEPGRAHGAVHGKVGVASRLEEKHSHTGGVPWSHREAPGTWE